MSSVAPTKIISWLKSPKSVAANIGIGVTAIGVVSAGTVSAFALTGSFNPVDDNAKSSHVAVKSAEKSQETATLDQNTAKTEGSATAEPSASESTSSATNSGSATAADTPSEPQTTPVPVVYSDTYPADLKNAAVSSKIDQWGLSNRQSTSYTAWKVNESFGNMPKWGYTSNGNASNWPNLADQSGVPRGTTPKAHSVGVTGNFTVWVEAINGDGTIDVSYYNGYESNGVFGYKTSIPASTFQTYIYFG